METATGIDDRVAVASAAEPTLRVRGSHGCQRIGRSAVVDAPPDGAETGVEVQ